MAGETQVSQSPNKKRRRIDTSFCVECGVLGQIRTAGPSLRRRVLYPAELRRHSLIFGLNTRFSASRSDNRFYGNSHFLWLVTNNFFCFFDSEANTFFMFNSCSIRFRTRSDLYSNLPVPASMRCSLSKHLGGGRSILLSYGRILTTN